MPYRHKIGAPCRKTMLTALREKCAAMSNFFRESSRKQEYRNGIILVRGFLSMPVKKVVNCSAAR